MTISQLEAEVPARQDELVFHNETSKQTTPNGAQQSKRNPPARNTSRFWFERFLAVIQRQNPTIIDSSFLSQIAPSNEGKLLSQLKFLGVVDDQGKPTKVLPLLNMVGDEQRRAFQEIVKESYKDLLLEVKVDKAVPDDLVNFFIRKYAFTRDKGINAAKFFLYLTEKGGISVSNELDTFLSEKTPVTSSPSSGAVSVARVSEKQFARGQGRESRASTSSNRQVSQRKFRSSEQEQASIQTVVSIKLDKDTPKEYWDRVLALIGERSVEVSVESNSTEGQSESFSENLDQDASPDSGFT
jgi:hypothetical protein